MFFTYEGTNMASNLHKLQGSFVQRPNMGAVVCGIPHLLGIISAHQDIGEFKNEAQGRQRTSIPVRKFNRLAGLPLVQAAHINLLRSGLRNDLPEPIGVLKELNACWFNEAKGCTGDLNRMPTLSFNLAMFRDGVLTLASGGQGSIIAVLKKDRDHEMYLLPDELDILDTDRTYPGDWGAIDGKNSYIHRTPNVVLNVQDISVVLFLPHGAFMPDPTVGARDHAATLVEVFRKHGFNGIKDIIRPKLPPNEFIPMHFAALISNEYLRDMEAGNQYVGCFFEP